MKKMVKENRFFQSDKHDQQMIMLIFVRPACAFRKEKLMNGATHERVTGEYLIVQYYTEPLGIPKGSEAYQHVMKFYVNNLN